MTKKALITGITGQDGSYLAELLIKKGYEVHGIKRRSSSFNTQRVDQIYQDPHIGNVNFYLHHGDMTDSTNLIRIIQAVKPDEIYNLAAMSHVHVSFETPEYTGNVDALGTLRILEAVRILELTDSVRIYHASTSELFGKVQEIPQTESTPFYPRSPYGVAKIYAYWITKNYREAYGMFACNGILFNHESPRRGETFVTRKITRGVAEIALGRIDCIYMGNLNAERDWGHAKDYVYGMWMMLQREKPVDYVISTGVKRSIREFAVEAFSNIGVRIEFEGTGVSEVGRIVSIDSATYAAAIGGVMDVSVPAKIGQIVLRVDPYYFRPTEVDLLLGDSSKIRKELNWCPKISFAEMVTEMVVEDIRVFRIASLGDRLDSSDAGDKH